MVNSSFVPPSTYRPNRCWTDQDAKAAALRAARPATAADVFATIGPSWGMAKGAKAFWHDGDASTPIDHLPDWEVTHYEAWYYYVARHPATGETFTYIEGDLYPGNAMIR